MKWDFKNFTKAELCHSQTAENNGIPNYPTPEIEADLHDFVSARLQPFRTHLDLPLTINSGFRSKRLCKLIGSKPTSHHALGRAVDIECRAYSTAHLAWLLYQWHEEERLPWSQIILEHHTPEDKHSGWVHWSFRRNDERGELRMKEKGRKGYPLITPLYLKDQANIKGESK